MQPQPTLNSWKDRRVLVTGATGFLGSHLVRRLVDAGAIVHGLARSPKLPDDLTHSAELHTVDVTDATAVAQVLSTVRPSVVFHLAAYGTLPDQMDAEQMHRVNVGGTYNVLDACRDAGRPIVVHTASCSELTDASSATEPDQRSLYAATKAAASDVCRAYQREDAVPCVIARLFTAYGPNEPGYRLVPTVTRALLSRRPPQITSGEQRRDFLYVEDLIEGLMDVAIAPAAVGKTLDLGTGQAVAVRDVVEELIRLSGRPVRAEYGAVEKRSDDQQVLEADPRPAANIAGWQARTSLEEGLRKTWAWYARSYVEKESVVPTRR